MRGLALLSILLAACAAPAVDDAPGECTPLDAPTVRAVAGPGPGMTTLVWDHVDGATGYELVEGKSVHALQHTRAVALHHAASVAVRAAPCGNGAEVSVSVLPGGPMEVGLVPATVDVSSDAFPVSDAAGQRTGERSWRIAEGTGNCCENYVTTDRQGRIYDFGGTYLHVSDDEGQTWQRVSTPRPYVNGEGAVVQAPNGDIVAIGWDPYSGDQLWAHKYAAIEDTWYYAATPLHTPFYDRPWIATIEGPFELEGVVAPYLTVAISNFGSSVAYLSLDGLHYTLVQAHALTSLLGGSIDLPAPDADAGRDWTQPIVASRVTDLGEGSGVIRRTPLCDAVAVTSALTWSCTMTDWPGHGIVDGAGVLHAVEVSDGRVRFSSLLDGWQTTEVATDMSVRAWDAKVHAGLDQAVVALHGQRGDTDVDLVVRLRGLADPSVEILQVGRGDSQSDAGVGGERRFDFMTVGFLPDGRVVLSFTDADRHPPALAIEMP